MNPAAASWMGSALPRGRPVLASTRDHIEWSVTAEFKKVGAVVHMRKPQRVSLPPVLWHCEHWVRLSS